jgi:hypothetical protein
MVQSAWTATASEAIWNVTVPPNTTARLLLSPEQANAYTINGDAISKQFDGASSSKTGQQKMSMNCRQDRIRSK